MKTPPPDREALIGTNQFEILQFSLQEYRDEGSIYTSVYGVNVAKVRRLLDRPRLVRLPFMHDAVDGIFRDGRDLVPVVSLARWLGIREVANRQPKIILVGFSDILLAVQVHETHDILRISWSDVHPPPAFIREQRSNHTLGTVNLAGGGLLKLLDVEEIAADVGLGRMRDALASSDEALAPVTGSAPADALLEEDVPRTVLVVDDARVARRATSKVLEGGGFKVLQASDGQEAWQILLSIHAQAVGQGKDVVDVIRLVVTDVEMPNMDGHQLARRIREHETLCRLWVVHHSSLGGHDNVWKGQQSGGDEYLVKFDPEKLLETAETYTRLPALTADERRLARKVS